MNAVTLAGVFVDEIKAAQRTVALGMVGNKIPGPDMVAVGSPLWQTGRQALPTQAWP